MADPAEVRRVIQERIMGVLRTEIAEIGGSADEIASRLLVHPSFESALEDLREHAAPSNSPGSGYSTPDSFAEGTRVGEQQHQRPSTARGDSNRETPCFSRAVVQSTVVRSWDLTRFGQ